MNESKDIRGLLKQEFEHFEADPGIDLWPEIEGELRPKKKRAAAWWSYTAVAASIAILFFCLFWLFDENPQTQIEREPGLVRVDTIYKERPIENPKEVIEDKFAEEQTSPIQSEESNNVQQNLSPVKRTRKTVVYPAKNLADSQPDSKQNVSPAPEKAHKNKDINVSQIAMQTMGPGLVPLTNEINRQDAPIIAVSQKQISRASKNEFTDTRNSIDLNNLTVENAVAFASNGLSKWKKSPIDFYQEKSPDGEVKVYQLDFLNLKITRKTRRAATKKL